MVAILVKCRKCEMHAGLCLIQPNGCRACVCHSLRQIHALLPTILKVSASALPSHFTALSLACVFTHSFVTVPPSDIVRRTCTAQDGHCHLYSARFITQFADRPVWPAHCRRCTVSVADVMAAWDTASFISLQLQDRKPHHTVLLWQCSLAVFLRTRT